MDKRKLIITASSSVADANKALQEKVTAAYAACGTNCGTLKDKLAALNT
jgi:hypothetical protein